MTGGLFINQRYRGVFLNASTMWLIACLLIYPDTRGKFVQNNQPANSIKPNTVKALPDIIKEI